MAIAPLQYTIDFAINFATPKNAFKALISLNRPLTVTKALLSSFSNTFVGLATEMAGTIKTANAFSNVLFNLSLVQKGLTLVFGQTFLVLDRMSGELATFRARVLAAFNPVVAVQNIDTLRLSLTSIVQTLHDTGSTWESVTELVVDSATKMKVASGVYAQVATAAGQYSTTEEQLKAVSDATISVARATGVAETQYGQLATTLGATVAATKLSNTAIKEYGNALTALTSTLPITVEYQNQFVDANALLISSGRLSANQVLAYGAVFEQAGVAVSDSVRSFSKLTQTLLAPAAATTEAKVGLEQLGYTVEDIAALMAQPGGLNTALTELLTRIQGISNTDPAAALATLQSIVGTSSSGQPTAQNIEQLANSLGLLQQNLSAASDSAGNAQLSEELQKIALEANPTLRLNQAFTNLADTWGTVLRPAVVTIANALADVVDWISGLVTGVRNVLQAVLTPLSIFYKALTTVLPVLTVVSNALFVLNASIIAVKLSAIALNKAGLALMAANIKSTALSVTGLDLVLLNLSHKLNSLYDILVNKVRPGFTGVEAGIKVSPWKQLTSTIANLGKLLISFAPQILLVGGAFLAVRSAVLTYTATMKQANKTKELIKGINQSAEELGKSFEVVEEKSAGVFSKIADFANNAMEAIRDNLSIFEHIGNAIGNEQLAAFKFATQAEASATQAAIAYGNLLTTIDKYGESYNKVVASLKATPTDPAALESGKNLIALLQKQKEALEKVEVTKEQAASRDVYVKSLDDQIRYVTKLTVGNDALANSIDQAAVSVENMEEALSNLRNKVGEELTKQVEKEIDTLKESAAKVEEIEKAKVDAANDTAKKQFDSQEKTISRQEQLADRQLDRARTKEDNAIQQRQESEDKAIEERYAKEDERYQESFDKKEAGIEKQQALEQAAIEAQQALEDKALDKQIAAEDKAIEDRIALEDKAIERQIAAEDKAIERITAAEDKQLQQRIEAEDEAIAAIIEAEDEALAKQIEDEDAAIAARLDKELTAIAARATAAEDAINAEVKLRDEALAAQLDRELEAVDAGLTAREEALAIELAAREAAANKLGETTTNNLEAQQQAALQAAEAAFNAQQRAQDAAYQQRKQGIEQAHSNKLTAQESTAKQRVLQLEEQFNTRLIDKQLAAVEQRKAKELESVSSREDAALKAFDRQQQLQNADTPKERARLQAEFEQTDKIEAQRQAIRDKYDAERLAKEAAAEKAKLALEAEKAKKEQELAAAKKKEEERAVAEKAKLEAQQSAALEKLELDKEAAKAERQAAYEKQQEELKLAFETKLQEAKAATENTLNELKLANEKAIEELKQAAESKRNELKLANEKQLEDNKLAAEEKITQLKLAAEETAEKLRLQYEAESEQRSLKRETDQDLRELQREQAAEQRALQREAQAEAVQLKRESAAEARANQREQAAATRADQREAQAEQLKEQREQAAEQRKLQREQAAATRAEQIESAKEARAEQFEDAKARRDEQRESAKESRDKQREEAAYQRQIKREDEDYARQIKREDEAAVRQEAFDAAKAERDKAYEAAKAERDKVLAEQVADREAELARELEIIKLQTQESIEQSYGEIVAKLKASADEIAAAARAANAGAAPSPSPGRRFKGGVVKTGLPYWVGEDRRTGRLTPNSELFIPSTDGYIANASQVWGMIKAAQSIGRYNRSVPSSYNERPKRRQEQQLASDVNVIKQQINKLARAVNDRTNTLATTQRNPIKPIVYYDL